jgi:hypothetical protein
LLDEGRDRRAPSPPAPDRQPTDQQPLTSDYSPGAIALAHKEGQLENGVGPAGAKGPWYRTRWGVTAIVIVIVLIIGAIVGGVVGGTHHSSSHKSNGGNGDAGTGNPNATGGSSNSSSSINKNPNNGVTPVNPTSTVKPSSTTANGGGGSPTPDPAGSPQATQNSQPASPNTQSV